MSDARAQTAGAAARASILGLLFLGWLGLGAMGAMWRIATGPPLFEAIASLQSSFSTPPQQTPVYTQTNTTTSTVPPPISADDRIFAMTRHQMLSSDVSNGAPSADVRDYAAFSDVGYYIEFDNADNDSLRVELLSNNSVVSACAFDQMYGFGSHHCEFRSLAPGDYQMRVLISGRQTGLLAFHVEEPSQETPSAQGDVTAPTIITNPVWIERPRPADLVALYPPRALRLGQQGSVVLDCLVDSYGRVGCNVASENPPGMGFGEASVRASRLFRMSPMLVDGKPSDGARVQVPMTWRLAN